MWLRRAAAICLLVASLVNACPPDVASVCECTNDQEGVILHCVNQPLNDLVHILLTNQAQLGLLKQLTIQSAPAANISAKLFDGLYIKKLVVQNCGIEHVDARAFDGLAQTLQDLNLAHNHIVAVPADALVKLTSLLTLDLSNNSITELPAHDAQPDLHKASAWQSTASERRIFECFVVAAHRDQLESQQDC